jgi:hypothetical protein
VSAQETAERTRALLLRGDNLLKSARPEWRIEALRGLSEAQG